MAYLQSILELCAALKTVLVIKCKKKMERDLPLLGLQLRRNCRLVEHVLFIIQNCFLRYKRLITVTR